MTQSILKRFSYLLNLTRTMFLFFNTPSVKTAMYVSLLFLLRKFAFPSRKNPRGEFPYESDGMFRLALGSEISDFGLTWGVWDGTSLYLPKFKYRLGLSIKKLTKNTVISGLL